MHILLIRFSSMGDVVLQTATVNWLKSLFGNKVQITFATSKEFASLVEGHPGVDRVVCLNRREDAGWQNFKTSLKAVHQQNPFTLILDLHGTMRSYRLRWAWWHIPSISVDKRRWERWLLTKVKIPFFKRFISKDLFGLENQVHRLIIDLKDIFGDLNPIERTKEFIHSKQGELTSLGELPAYPGLTDYTVLAPSASFNPKRWPVERFVELARQLIERGEKVVILAGPTDNFCDVFNDLAGERLINLQGKTSLRESMSIIKGAKLCVGNDSGMNHIAEAYGVRCITLFGPTDPRFGFAPHAENSSFVSKNIWCKPCSTTGSKKCFRASLVCMEMISVREVYEMCMEKLS